MDRCLLVALEDALENHSHTFDLRTPFESKVWIKKLSDKVQKFSSHGGYRLYPDSIAVNQNDRTLNIYHFWKNFGVGVLPNSHPNWDKKYKVSFALLHPNSGKVIHTFADLIANPGKWIKGPLYGYYDFEYTIAESLKSGTYYLAVSIIDSTTGKVGIKLSVKDNQLNNGWALIGDLEIE